MRTRRSLAALSLLLFAPAACEYIAGTKDRKVSTKAHDGGIDSAKVVTNDAGLGTGGLRGTDGPWMPADGPISSSGVSTAGVFGSGGMAGTTGMAGAGGVGGSAGWSTTGSVGAGGAMGTGGRPDAGMVATAGSTVAGGSKISGGSPATGGATSTGGKPNGGTSSGGTVGVGGTVTMRSSADAGMGGTPGTGGTTPLGADAAADPPKLDAAPPDLAVDGGGGTGALFAEDFEDGKTDGWTLAFPDVYMYAVTSGTGAKGTDKSLMLTKISDTVYCCEGFYRAFAPPLTPTTVSYWIRAEQTGPTVGYFRLNSTTNASTAILYSYFAGSDIRMTAAQAAPPVSFSASRWYHIELRNIDWRAGTFAYFVDGAQVGGTMNMDPTATGIARIDLFSNRSSTSTAPVVYFDEIELR